MNPELSLFRPECFLNSEEQCSYEKKVEQKIRAFNASAGGSSHNCQTTETTHLEICLNVFKEMVLSGQISVKVW
jgi:hypothetical protein